MAEDYQNDNLLISYQLLVFFKISRAEDVHFAVSYDRRFTQNRDIKSQRKICNSCY